jgi:hypothetical protein
MTRLLLAAALGLVPAPSLAATVDDIIAEARDFCASFDSGVLTVGSATVLPVDLTGDGSADDTAIDWSGMDCSTMASAWGGTGGTTLTFLVNGKRFDELALGWSIVDFGGPVLLLSQHGANCGLTGVDRCVEALVWSAGTLTGTTPEPAN